MAKRRSTRTFSTASQLDLFSKIPPTELEARIKHLNVKIEKAILDKNYSLAEGLTQEQKKLLKMVMEWAQEKK